MGGRLTREAGMSIDAWCIVWSGAPMTRRKASVGRAWSGTVVVPSRVVIEIWLPFADGGSVVVVVVAPIVVVVGAPVVVVVPTIVVLVVPPIVVVVAAASVVVVVVDDPGRMTKFRAPTRFVVVPVVVLVTAAGGSSPIWVAGIHFGVGPGSS